jgi:hypothetical protein
MVIIIFALLFTVSICHDNEGQLHHQESEELNDSRNLKDEHLLNLVQVCIM